MLRNPMISPKALFPFCHAMSRMLEAGIDIRKALETAVKSSRDARLRNTVYEVSRLIKSGHDLTSSFRKYARHYPRLFIDLVTVGEETGSLPEIMDALGDYYEARVQTIRDFRSAIAWPMLQLFAAIMVIGLLIYLLGLISSGTGAPPIDFLGLGLHGTSGALTWFGLTFGTIAGIWLVWTVVSRNLTGKVFLDPFLLGIPAVGNCLKKFAIARFAWCFSLTQGAGMSIKPSLTSSLNATANGAFIAANPIIWKEIHDGATLGKAMRASKIFPSEFLHFVDTAEQTGTVPEAMNRMSRHFDDEAQRALKFLTILAARMVWAGVAVMIVFFIFRIAMVYVGMLNGAAAEALG